MPRCTERRQTMQNYKLFIRSMRVMGKKRFVYLGSIFVMLSLIHISEPTRPY